MNKNFEKRLLSWADKAVTFCHDVATDKTQDFDLSFFAFRTSPIENPDVLFLGINPGGEAYKYEDLYKNANWGLLDEQRMTSGRFIKPDVGYESKETWPLWKGLKKTFKNNKLNEMLGNSMIMNIVYFNTPNLDNLLKRPNGKFVFQENLKLTIELITQIIKPKNIICLGTGDCFDKLPLTNKQILLNGKKRLVVKGMLVDIDVFGIPHPSGSYTSDADREKIGDVLNGQLN